MKRDEALAELQSRAMDRRLEAARALIALAKPEDVSVMQKALASEPVVWVQSALKRAILRLSRSGAELRGDIELEEIVPAEAAAQIRTIAVNNVTRQIVHEIAPIVGVLRMHAEAEVADYSESSTHQQIERLSAWLDALNRLSAAAVAPKLAEFDLAETVRNTADGETVGRHVRVDLAGSSPLLLVGDSSLVELALSNGIRNAIEAVELTGAGEELPPVVVTWGETDRDFWIAVLDRGMGPPAAANRAFEIGSTTKKGHLGMGLATARQAIQSLGGEVNLTARGEGGGARFDLRWPKFEQPG
jgi:signal transduction histidine kinase